MYPFTMYLWEKALLSLCNFFPITITVAFIDRKNCFLNKIASKDCLFQKNYATYESTKVPSCFFISCPTKRVLLPHSSPQVLKQYDRRTLDLHAIQYCVHPIFHNVVPDIHTCENRSRHADMRTRLHRRLAGSVFYY